MGLVGAVDLGATNLRAAGSVETGLRARTGPSAEAALWGVFARALDGGLEG